MTDHLSIGSTPAEESCAQVGREDYYEAARAECLRFIDLIRKTVGPEPPGARLHIHSNPHDFGTYLEVCVQFDVWDKEAADYAYRVEDKAPMTWKG